MPQYAVRSPSARPSVCDIQVPWSWVGIELGLLWRTNRKSHARFRFVPKSMTFDDLQRPKRSLAEKFTEPTGLEVFETNCPDNSRSTFDLRSPKAIHLLPGEHEEILRRLEVGWEKVACWSTKAAIIISLKYVKLDEKLLRRAYRNSSTLFRTVPSLTPYGLLFPKIWGSQPRPKL